MSMHKSCYVLFSPQYKEGKEKSTYVQSRIRYAKYSYTYGPDSVKPQKSYQSIRLDPVRGTNINGWIHCDQTAGLRLRQIVPPAD